MRTACVVASPASDTDNGAASGPSPLSSLGTFAVTPDHGAYGATIIALRSAPGGEEIWSRSCAEGSGANSGPTTVKTPRAMMM